MRGAVKLRLQHSQRRETLETLIAIPLYTAIPAALFHPLFFVVSASECHHQASCV